MRIAVVLLAALFASLACAQPYPSKPIRFVVATGPGGGDDFVARLLAPKLSELLGQQVFVENRPGAGGMVGQTFVAKSAPDGYTVLLAGGSMAGARYVNATMTYELLRDFTPISVVETSPFVLVVNASFPARHVKAFISHARANPNKLTFGTLGAGQIPYWSVALFNSMAAIDAVEVQYKGVPDAIVDILAGRLDYSIVPLGSDACNREKLRSLVVSTHERAELQPDVPTMAEAALPAYEMSALGSIIGPAGLRAQTVRILNPA